MSSIIYTLQQGNKTISTVYNKRYYVIGFRNDRYARKVHYNIHPDPKFDIVRKTDIDLSKDLRENGYDLKLNVDVEATLFIPKCAGGTLDPMNDAGLHLSHYKESEFIMFPIEKRLGIIIPYDLEEETDDEFMFKSYMIDPI